MTQKHLADAQALVTTILQQNGTLKTVRESTIRTIVEAVAKDLEAIDLPVRRQLDSPGGAKQSHPGAAVSRREAEDAGGRLKAIQRGMERKKDR
jgi:hypothetical protein